MSSVASSSVTSTSDPPDKDTRVFSVVGSVASTFYPLDRHVVIAEATASITERLEELEYNSNTARELLRELDEKCAKDLSEFTTLMMNIVMTDQDFDQDVYETRIRVGTVPTYCWPENRTEIEHFQKAKDRRLALISRIACSTDEMEDLNEQMKFLAMDSKDIVGNDDATNFFNGMTTAVSDRLFEKEVTDQILTSPVMKELECSICNCIGVPATFKFPCALITRHDTGCVQCSAPLCSVCACRISYKQNACCPWCRCKLGNFRFDEDVPYAVNMQLVRTTDAYLANENKEFMKRCGRSLDLIKCNHCEIGREAAFDSLADLNKHMHQKHRDLQ